MVDYEKLAQLFQTEEFQQEAATCKSMEDFQVAFSRHGFMMSSDEVVDLISKIAEKKQEIDSGELSEEDLENVAGGLVGAAAVAACIGIGVLCIGAFALSAYVAYQALRWTYKGK